MKKLRIILDVLRCELIGKHRSINEIQFDYPIDFVISWVDCHDPDWLQEKEKMQSDKGLEDNGPERYRDWEQLVYWFRAVEKYAPWVRKIHFVTYGHLPKWLNTNHRKLNVVNHKDYIPEQYLPTFSSSVIELNFQRISGLSEHFVYFNDDMFLNSECKKQDFFNGDYPKYCSAITPLKAYGKPKVHYHKILNILSLMNGYFDIHKCIHKHPELWFNKCNKKNYKHIRRAYRENYLQGMNHTHLGMPLRKTTIKKVWEVFPEALEITCNNKFRSLEDVQQQMFHLWDILNGEFYPVSTTFFGKYYTDLVGQIDEVEGFMLKEKGLMICLNDTDHISNSEFEYLKKRINKIFEKKFPEKSSFEL